MGRQLSVNVQLADDLFLWTSGPFSTANGLFNRMNGPKRVTSDLVDTTSLPIFDATEPLEDIFQKILYLTRPEHIQQVFVQGECCTQEIN